MNGQAIEQQYYTRGRQGVFRSNEGYDTIARSAGLDNNFIKKSLHPFCVYDVPRELQERGETDLACFPEAFLLFRTESGDLVVGQSAYVGADFTGQRNTFFSHNYVIPAARRDEYVKQPAKLFGITSFATSYEETRGRELPALREIPYQDTFPPRHRKQALQQIGVDELLFKQLLFAVMSSFIGKKKVFISLDAELSEWTRQAKLLLSVLYESLPYEMRRQLGFLTYSNEPQSRKHLHVVFVEKGSIRSGSGSTGERDFLFDLPNGRIVNADVRQGEHEYLSFAWEYLDDPHVLHSFFEFAEEVLAGDDTGKALHLATYYELCTLHLIEKGRSGLYAENKAGILHVVLSYLDNDRLHNKKRLHELFRGLFREEAGRTNAAQLPDPEWIKQIIAYFPLAESKAVQNELVLFLLKVLLMGKQARESGYVAQVYRLAAENRSLFAFMMNTIFHYEKMVAPLFEEYLALRLANLTQIEQVWRELQFWANTSAEAVQNRFFRSAVKTKLVELFAREADQVAAAVQIHQSISEQRVDADLSRAITDEVDARLLRSVRLGNLTKVEFVQLAGIFMDKPDVFVNGLDRQSRKTYEFLLHLDAVWRLNELPDPDAVFPSLACDEEDVLEKQQVLRRLLAGNLDSSRFVQTALAFCKVGAPVTEAYHYEELLEFVHRHGGDRVIHPFIHWSASQKAFTGGRYLIPEYRKAVKQYLLRHQAAALRGKETRARWYDLPHPDLRKLLDEVRAESASGLVRFLRKYKLPVFGGVVVAVSAGTVAGMMLLGEKPEPPAPVLPAITDEVVTPGQYSRPAGPTLEELNQQPAAPGTPAPTPEGGASGGGDAPATSPDGGGNKPLP